MTPGTEPLTADFIPITNPSSERGAVHDENGEIDPTLPPATLVVFRDANGEPSADMVHSTERWVDQRPLRPWPQHQVQTVQKMAGIDSVSVLKAKRGLGLATQMYDFIQDSGEINLYDAIGRLNDLTEAGKAFAEAWLQHRSVKEALGFGQGLVERTADNEVQAAGDEEAERQIAEVVTMIGWEGIVSPEACDRCQTNVGFHPKDEPIYRHPNCGCEKAYVFSSDRTPHPFANGYPEEWKYGRDPDSQDYYAGSEDRQAWRDFVINDTMDGLPTSDDPVLYMTGGGPASGKSMFLNDEGMFGIPGDESAIIDPDRFKLAMPEYRDAVAEGHEWAASWAHEESSQMAKDGVARGLSNGYDVVYDSVGDNGYESLSSKIAKLKAAKPDTKVVARYATIDIDEAIARADARAAQTGRKVDHDEIIRAHKNVSETVNDAIKADFFDDLQVWDNSGDFDDPATLIVSKQKGEPLNIYDPALWQKFLAKVNYGE
jgi:predicted ABC-type ATPase